MPYLARISRVMHLSIIGNHVRSIFREGMNGEGKEVLLGIEPFPCEAFVGRVPDGVVGKLDEETLHSRMGDRKINRWR